MKYTSALMFVTVLGVGLPLLAAEARAVTRSASKQIVFVDKAELARLHPGWQALNDMRSVLDGKGLVVGNSPTGAGPNLNYAAGDSRRSELVAKAAQDACAALAGLETRKYEALRARREAMKSQLLKSAESDWKAEARNIEKVAAVDTKSVDDRYASDLVNARLRASASEVASKVSRMEGSGMDKEATDQHVQAVAGDLAEVGRVGGAEKDRIMAAANAKIEAIRQAAEKRVTEQVNLYEAEQGKLIADSIAAARSDIAQELGPASTPGLFTERQPASASSGDGTGECRVDRLVDLRAAASALQVRIDKDVCSIVLDLAAVKGLKVTFERHKGETRDATRIFAEFIKKHGWNAGWPALCGSGSS